MSKRCKHNAGWWTDDVLLWGDGFKSYLEDGSATGRKRTRGKLVLRCNMQGCDATRNAYFRQPMAMRLGKIRSGTST